MAILQKNLMVKPKANFYILTVEVIILSENRKIEDPGRSIAVSMNHGNPNDMHILNISAPMAFDIAISANLQKYYF